MNVTEKKMTLEKAIEHLKSGAGWWDQSFPRAVGHTLETITKENDISEDTNITLIEETWETGWGPNHSYHYQYRVKGLSLESDNGKIYTPETLVFGGSVPEASIENGDIIFYWAK